jgi:hypothetical protein
VEMVLLDWTRMGKLYCLAGVVQQNGQLPVVRPLPAAQWNAPVRNVGWSPYLMDGHSRWEIFESIDPQSAEASPPHLEDLWVRNMKSRGTFADPAVRRAILHATRTQPGEPWFGAELTTTRSCAYLAPRTGQRSLVSVWSATARAGNLGSASVPIAWTAGTSPPSPPLIWVSDGAGRQWGAALFDDPV